MNNVIYARKHTFNYGESALVGYVREIDPASQQVEWGIIHIHPACGEEQLCRYYRKGAEIAREKMLDRFEKELEELI